MRIYIDEAGGFIYPPSGPQSFSLVLALIIPSSREKDLFYKFLRLRDSWPKQEIEIKGSKLDEPKSAQVIELLCDYDVLVEFQALDLGTHSDGIVNAFRVRQADAVTANISRAHHPDMAYELHLQSETIRKMPNQLFLQAFLTIHLIIDVLRNATLYYVQRQPAELGDIAWIIDRKNRELTEMEKTWTSLVLPISEGTFAREPFGTLEGADYSHFHGRYSFTSKTMSKEMVRHLEWLHSIHGLGPMTEGRYYTNAKRLLTEQRQLLDSRDSLGLQLADMLASILRRALNGRLQIAGWKDFGRLLVHKRDFGNAFIQFGKSENLPKSVMGLAREVCRVLDRRAKSMLLGD
jgi:hypothetical protein